MWSSILTLALASPASSATVVLDGIYSTFKTGGSQNDVVDRALFKMRDDSHVELYRNGEVGQTTPISPDGVRLSQSFDFHDGVLSGCDGCDGVTGSVQANGDIVWSHGYTSRKDAPDISGVYYSFATGGSPSSVVDRFEARQAGNHVTFYRNGAVGQTTPIRAETATAGESYTVEGNTLSGLGFAVTGTVDSNGDIVWSHGYTSRKQSSVPAPSVAKGPASPHIAGNQVAPAPQPQLMTRDALWDRKLHPNQGPRPDQNLVCLTIFCAGPFVLCPVHCLSAWGCADLVGMLTCLAPKPLHHVPCCICSPRSKNPLWCCAEPIGWAASHGQLHTVMALVANGADPHAKNGASQNAFTDAEREKHTHVVKWLKAWEAAGKPARV